MLCKTVPEADCGDQSDCNSIYSFSKICNYNTTATTTFVAQGKHCGSGCDVVGGTRTIYDWASDECDLT